MLKSLDEAIDVHAADLVETPTLNGRALLHAIAEVETAHGSMRLASRHEKSYCYGGVFYAGPNGADLREQTKHYGCLAHSSFGTWQIMFITAHELGFAGDPVELRNDETSIVYVVRLLNRRILNRYPRISPAAFADAYNSGSPSDQNIPAEYMTAFEAAYAKWLRVVEPPEQPVTA